MIILIYFLEEKQLTYVLKDGRQKALDAIKLKSSDKFFKDCFDTVFPKVNVDVVVNLIFEEEPKPKHVSNEPELVFNLELITFKYRRK